MTKEITQSIIAVIIVAGAVFAALTGNENGVQYLVGIAGIVIGSYFGKPVTQAFGKFFKK